MEVKADTSRVLMSDVLKGQLPEHESNIVDQLEAQYIHVVADRYISNQSKPLVGLLRTVLFDTSPEIEIKIEISEALATVKAEQLVFNGFELQHGDETLQMPGPFNVKAARIQEIDPATQTCVLALHLGRVNKT